VWIEVVFVHIEWCRNLATFIQVFLFEHSLTVVVVDDVTSLGVNEITTLVCFLASVIFELRILIRIGSTFSILIQSNNVTLFVPFKVTDDIAFVELA